MIIYMDVIWFLNFLVDSLLLWVTAIFLKRDVKTWRILLGGLMGSSLILLAITPVAALASHPVIKMFVSFCMVLTVFGFKRLKSFMSCLLTFYFSTFLMGGVLLGTHYLLTYDLKLRTAVSLESIRGFGDPVSWLFVAAAFPAAWHFSKRRVEDLTISSIEYDVLIDATIRINGLDLQLKGLIDSGNQLYDPISKTPVMIASISTFNDQLPDEIAQLADKKNNPIELADTIPDSWSEKMRLIPAKTVGNNNQLLCAFKPDALLLQTGEERRVAKKVLIVFTDQELSSDGRFQCIVHPAMVEQAVVQNAS
ncbi:sigma-E processing peptidase SpoIIGA [Siminovitchia acidinfaciens]|uniref:Sporulation sigma-E factor-processing peptidase n=1 Tax=Siminovitchia acidinfaciens TaxID=2321395 RepID=A0A429Y2D3_9BACI|nr:sigma-E processing peptidase SpoIIGA [Siminovitchia acidinfaciens]RST75411.1 sigma-E processing peptidase SpoIIGA [Siminovitchia acidinfaciens]